LKPEEMTPHLPIVLGPLMGVMNDTTNKSKNFTSLKTLAQEVLDLVKERVGPTVFFEAYNEARMRQEALRDERKQKKAFEAVLNPEKTAQRKIQRNLQKKDSRKRKIEQYTKAKPWKQVKRSKISNDHRQTED